MKTGPAEGKGNFDRLQVFWGFSANKPPVQPGVGKKTLVNGRENLL